MLLSSWASSATTASKGVPDTQSREENETSRETAEELADTFPICQPEGARVLGGFGPPRICDLPGGPRDFHDGGGLCSPGRWPPDRRNLADSDSWSWLRNKLFEKAARRAGSVDELEREGLQHGRWRRRGLPASQGPALHQGAGRYHGELDRGAGLGRSWHFKRRMTRIGTSCYRPRSDSRWASWSRYHELHTSSSRRKKWPLENIPWEPALAWVPNYGSTRDHLNFAKAKFDEEIEEGLMEKMSPETFKERFGENTAIAALAVIVQDEEKDKKRLIHDATHGVRVNHRIKCRDKLRAPGAREKKQLLLEAMDRKERPFSIVGFLACQPDARDGPVGQLDNSCVYISKVGTFGVNCASYWWTRVAACGIRATHHLLGRCPIDMLLYADDLESLATARRGRIAIVLSYCYLTALGYPFKWSKTRAGYRVEWLGMETEYSSYRLGLTEKRAGWLVAWLRALRRWRRA